MGPDGAVVTHLVSEDTNRIPKPQWDAMRPGMACVSEEDVGWLRGQFEKFCSEKPIMCVGEPAKVVKAFLVRLDKRRARRR